VSCVIAMIKLSKGVKEMIELMLSPAYTHEGFSKYNVVINKLETQLSVLESGSFYSSRIFSIRVL
jgi:hypothetical protein